MNVNDYQHLIDEIHSGTPARALAARMIILSAQEAAVDKLVDLYYAGSSDTRAAILFELLAEIGGPDALAVLRNVFTYEDSPSLKQSAARGLLHNLDNLSPDEADEITRYLTDLRNV